MDIISTDIFNFVPIDNENRGTVYINGQKTKLSLTGEKLEVCIQVDQYYAAFITYYSRVADESKHLAIYLIDQDYTLLSRKEVFGSATTYMFGEDVDDRFYGLELREPNIILFDFVYTNQHQLTIYAKKTMLGSYWKLKKVRNFQRERLMKRVEYKVSGRIGHQSVVINKFDGDKSNDPKITLETPFYNNVFSDKSQVFLDGKYTQLTLDGTFLKNIIKIEDHYLFIIRIIVNNYCWDNFHLVSADFRLLESFEIHREYDFLNVIIDTHSQQNNSFIIAYSGEDKAAKKLIHHQWRCWVAKEKSYSFLWFPRFLSFLHDKIYRKLGFKSYFRFKKVKTY